VEEAKIETPVEDKSERERGRTEKKEEWFSPRTHAQIQETARVCL
jgi:hypothetical protein